MLYNSLHYAYAVLCQPGSNGKRYAFTAYMAGGKTVRLTSNFRGKWNAGLPFLRCDVDIQAARWRYSDGRSVVGHDDMAMWNRIQGSAA